MRETGIGTSLILISTGAVLALALNVQSTVVDVTAIGVILMVVGGVGLLLSFLFAPILFNWPSGGLARRDRDTEPSLTPPHVHRRIKVKDVLNEQDDDESTIERIRQIER